MKKNIQPIVSLIVLLLLSMACGTSSSLDPIPPLPTVQEQESTVEPSLALPTEAPTDIPQLVNTPVPTQVTYIEPVLLGEVDGTGKTVTDDINMPACTKAVFSWNVAASSYGTASLILSMFKKGSDRESLLVNEMALDIGSEGLSGSSVQPLLGGEYYFSSDNTSEVWHVRIECQDGAAPLAVGMDIEGVGNLVTGNYELPACQKSVFSWEVKPGSSGTAALILDLCGSECQNIANDMKMDLTGPLQGKSLQSVSAGNYYLVTQNAGNLPWHVTWECKD